MSRAARPFWLGGEYDEAAQACPARRATGRHAWVTLRLAEVLVEWDDPDELFTICKACYVPRCGYTADRPRCILGRHHVGDHNPQFDEPPLLTSSGPPATVRP